MKRMISFCLLLTLVCFGCGAEAREVYRVKNLRYASATVYEDEGRLFGDPEVLNVGGAWWVEKRPQGCRAYVKVTERGATFPVDLPLAEDGTADLSFFAAQAGLSWTVNEKKEILFSAVAPVTAVPREKDVILVWDSEERFDAKAPFFTEADGVRLLSPEWGVYTALSPDFSYVAAAESVGVSVMPLVHNDFDPAATAKFMRDRSAQQYYIRQMTALAVVYGLAGWNIDFENMNPADKGLFTDFMKSLTESLHAKGKLVSVDIVVPGDETSYWNGAYDRRALAEFVDYEVVMGYDQTARAGGRAGPNSAYDWLDGSMAKLLDMVPAEKLILGLPLYTRLWEGEDGAGLRTQVLTHRGVKKLASEKTAKLHWDEKTKSFYVDRKETGVRRRVWLEEAASLREKLGLIEKYNLAGSAWWRYGFEAPELYEELAGAV